MEIWIKSFKFTVSNLISIICQTNFELNFERITCQNKRIKL